MKLEPYLSQVQPTTHPGAVRVDAGAAVADLSGLRQASAALAAFGNEGAEMARQQQQRRAAVEASALDAELRGTWVGTMAKAEAEAPPDASGFRQSMLAQFDADAKARLDAAKPEVREHLSLSLARLRADIDGRATGFEAVRAVEAQKVNLLRTVSAHANTVRTDASQFDAAMEGVSQAVAASNLVDKDGALRTAGAALARSYYEGLNETNPARAQQELTGGRFKDVLSPEAFNVLVNDNNRELKFRENQRKAEEAEARRRYEHSQAMRRAALSEDLADDRLRIADGLAPRVSTAEIRAAYADMPETATRILRERDIKSEAAPARKQIMGAAIGEDEKILAAHAPSGDAAAPGYAHRREVYQSLAQDLARKRRALAEDPAGYVLAQSPELQAARKAAAEDPSKMGAFVTASLEMQDRMGIPAAARAALPRAAADGMVMELATIKPEARGARITQMAESYGGHWPSVFRDLARAGLDDASQVLATVSDPVARTRLSEALAIPKDDLRKSAGAAAADIDKSIKDSDSLKSLARTLSFAPNGAAIVTRYDDAVKRLAYRYAMAADSGVAADKAVKDLISSRWDILDDDRHLARTPAGLGATMERTAAAVLTRLTPAAIAIPAAREGETLTDVQRQQVALDQARRGKWITTENEDGWMLLDPLGNPVKTPDGGRIEVKFTAAGWGR